MTKSLLFFIIALAFFWLVLDQFYGKQIIGQFVQKMIPASADN